AFGDLRAFEQRFVHVGAMNHRVRIAEPFDEGLGGRNAADLVLVERIEHHHLVSVDGARTGELTDAQCVECGKTVRSDLEAGADFAELWRLLEHLDRKAAVTSASDAAMPPMPPPATSTGRLLGLPFMCVSSM